LKGEWKSTGDPTEVALQVFSSKLKLGRASLTSSSLTDSDEKMGQPAMGPIIETETEKESRVRFKEEPSQVPKRFEAVTEYPFSSELKRMTVIYSDNEHPDDAVVFIKGAVCSCHIPFFLPRCTESNIRLSASLMHPSPTCKTPKQTPTLSFR